MPFSPTKLIKVCGMREAENIRAVEQLAAPDWMGFIFYPKSPRYVSERPAYLPQCRRIGVFVHPTLSDVLQRAEEFGLWGIQLYDTPPAVCDEIRQRGLRVIVALSVTADIVSLAAPYTAVADYFLFDTPTVGYGGSGQRFDHSLLSHYAEPVPFLLSGGLGIDAIETLRAFSHPKCVGIDVNSRFETSPAYKDATLLQQFVAALRDDEPPTSAAIR